MIAALALLAMAQAQEWPQHSMDRPRPPLVQPAPLSAPVAPPADAIVLFDGKDLAAWRDAAGRPAPWAVRDGSMEVVPGAGPITSAHAFGDVQLHIEWATPALPRGTGQDRGNSGVFLMGIYEVQVLDSHQNDTYPDGQAGAIYGQNPPLVNASRPPGQWQTYDIVFRRPRFTPDGSLERPARLTVLHNGVLVQDGFELLGPTSHRVRAPYRAHADRLPLTLQDHGSPVRYRQIWVRELSLTP